MSQQQLEAGLRRASRSRLTRRLMTIAGQKALTDHLAINADARAALTKIGWAILLAVGSALAGVVVSLVPALQVLIEQYVPALLIPAALGLLNLLTAYLAKAAAKDTKAAVSKALITPVPEPFNSSYSER